MPFDILHSDLWTSSILSSAGHKYYVFETFKSLTQLIQTQFLQKVKTFQCDNGGEYNNEHFQKYCTDHGLVFRFSCPHTSSQNGKSGCKIRTINNMIRTMLAHLMFPLVLASCSPHGNLSVQYYS